MAEKQSIALEFALETDKANLSLGELEKGFETMKDRLKEVGRGSEEFKQLSTAMAETGREVKNIELGFEALDNDQVASELGGIAGAAGDVTAAFVLMSGENETMQEMAASIEKAMAISIGFKGAIEGVSSGMKLYNNLLKTSTAAQKIQTVVTNVAAVAQKALNAIMKANPIAILVTAILSAVAAYKLFAIEADAAGDAQRAYATASEEATKSTVKEKVQLDQLVETAKNDNLTKHQRQQAIEKLNKLSPEYLGNITLETINTEAATKALDAYVESLEMKARAQALESMLVEESTKLIELEKIAREGEFSTLQQINNITGKGIQTQEQLNLVNAKNVQIQKDKIRELSNLMKADTEEAENHDLANMTRMSSTLNVEQLEKDVQKSREDREKWRQEHRNKDNDVEIARIESNSMAEIKQEELDRTISFAEVEIMTAENLSAEKRRLLQEEIDLAKEADARRQEQLNTTQSGLNIMKAGADAFIKDEVKREKVRKKLAVAQLAVDTARSISSGIAAAAGIPFPGNLIAFAPTIAAILANIAQAKSLLGRSGGVSLGGGSSIGSAASGASTGGGGAQFDTVSNASTILGNQNVTVVETDITNTQNNVNVIEESATF